MKYKYFVSYFLSFVGGFAFGRRRITLDHPFGSDTTDEAVIEKEIFEYLTRQGSNVKTVVIQNILPIPFPSMSREEDV